MECWPDLPSQWQTCPLCCAVTRQESQKQENRRRDGGHMPNRIAELAGESNGYGGFWLTAPSFSTLLVPIPPGWRWLNSTVLPSSPVSREEVGSSPFLKSRGICARQPPPTQRSAEQPQEGLSRLSTGRRPVFWLCVWLQVTFFFY